MSATAQLTTGGAGANKKAGADPTGYSPIFDVMWGYWCGLPYIPSNFTYGSIAIATVRYFHTEADYANAAACNPLYFGLKHCGAAAAGGGLNAQQWWLASVYARNMLLLWVVYEGQHQMLHNVQWFGTQGKLARNQDGTPKMSDAAQLRRERLATCFASLIWSFFEAANLYIWANPQIAATSKGVFELGAITNSHRISSFFGGAEGAGMGEGGFSKADVAAVAAVPGWSSLPFKSNVFLWNFVMLAIIPLYREFHFYIIHRFIHINTWYFPMYKWVHSFHHKSYNPTVWSGLSMHPVEVWIYFQCAALQLFLPLTPFHFIFNLQHTTLTPGAGHSGWDPSMGVHGGSYFHYLHHRYFECNYGEGTIPVDKWFNTFRSHIDDKKKN